MALWPSLIETFFIIFIRSISFIERNLWMWILHAFAESSQVKIAICKALKTSGESEWVGGR